MTVKPILMIRKHQKFLQTPSEPVKKINKDIKQLLQDIRDTIEKNPAIGLAAPQIGIHKRVCGVRLSYSDYQKSEEMSPPTLLINPEIIERGEIQTRGHDACLSIPGMMGYTNRHQKITVRYLDEEGHKVERNFEDWDARVIQHEIDHLDGILFLDRLDSLNDLYVYVEDKEGKLRPVPYNDVIKQAATSANADPLSVMPLLKK